MEKYHNELERDIDNFVKMYPGVDYENKYILWLDLELWWPYTRGKVECDLHFDDSFSLEQRKKHPLLNGKTTLPVRHYVPNTRYNMAGMRNGRNQSSQGAVLYFDTLEELEQIKTVSVTWKINKALDGCHDLYIQCFYDLTFEKDPSKKVYTLSDLAKSLRYNQDEIDTDRYLDIYLKDDADEGFVKGDGTAYMLYRWFDISKVANFAEQYRIKFTLEPNDHAKVWWTWQK